MHHISAVMLAKPPNLHTYLGVLIFSGLLISCRNLGQNKALAVTTNKRIDSANKESFQEQLSGYRLQLGECYMAQLKRDPQSRGRILLEVGLSSEGKVDSLKTLEDSVGAKIFEDCVLERAASWAFDPPPSEGVLLHIPLDFEATFVDDEASTR